MVNCNDKECANNLDGICQCESVTLVLNNYSKQIPKLVCSDFKRK